MKNNNDLSNTMICKIQNIHNAHILDSLEEIDRLVNIICLHNHLKVINKLTSSHNDSSEYSLMYVLDDECHLVIKTFPRSSSLMLHLIFYKNFDHSDCCLINDFLIRAFDADRKLSTVEFDDITTIM